MDTGRYSFVVAAAAVSAGIAAYGLKNAHGMVWAAGAAVVLSVIGAAYARSKKQGSDGAPTSSLDSKIKSIWEVGGRSSGNDSAGSKREGYGDKPFGSKYYYAHNGTCATGGYKDGLKMEDYRMNGPRLLSRGGAPVAEEEEGVGTNEGNEGDRESNVTESSRTVSSVVDPGVTSIKKYLWDDPGDKTKGVATIRIDSLPGSDSDVPWTDIAGDVNSVEAELFGEGLVVRVDAGRRRFQLRIAKLYGDAKSVEAHRFFALVSYVARSYR